MGNRSHSVAAFVITHKMSLEDAQVGFDIFNRKDDDCLKAVLQA
ncbi:MAG TPA: hypothetical protein VJ840_14000 [Gemmatimonadaceae bacterium]|nr:hypothetical protein [Gemmatimonadaceae bacterium]